MTNIAVTAASGQLGAEIVNAVAAVVGREKVIGLARSPDKAKSLGVEVRPGDYNAPADLEDSLQGVQAVLLVSGMDKPENRITQHRNVIDAARKAGVQKIVYTSIQGTEENTAFSPIVHGNRQTEQDVRNSGLQWTIGRNGIYVEPDIEYLDTYQKHGEIANCAGSGKCGYTTRRELAFAYANMLTSPHHNGQTYNLHGDRITQQQLAGYLNDAFGTDLQYCELSVEEYRAERIAELGEFLGSVIAGIYEGIKQGAYDNESHFSQAAGRPHQDWKTIFQQFAAESSR